MLIKGKGPATSHPPSGIGKIVGGDGGGGKKEGKGKSRTTGGSKGRGASDRKEILDGRGRGRVLEAERPGGKEGGLATSPREGGGPRERRRGLTFNPCAAESWPCAIRGDNECRKKKGFWGTGLLDMPPVKWGDWDGRAK